MNYLIHCRPIFLTNTMKKENSKIPYTITKEGSLGLLALGDIGLRAWRKVKNSDNSKNTDNVKK